MADAYEPPQMPPFPSSLDELYHTLAPYHRDQRPLDLFFELLVVDVLGLLPRATQEALGQLSIKHPTFFAATNGDWRAGVRHMLHLSQTIDVAILDLWFVNREKALKQGWDYHPWHYAQNFAQSFLAEGSRVDVWEGDALDLAKARIKAARERS